VGSLANCVTKVYIHPLNNCTTLWSVNGCAPGQAAMAPRPFLPADRLPSPLRQSPYRRHSIARPALTATAHGHSQGAGATMLPSSRLMRQCFGQQNAANTESTSHPHTFIHISTRGPTVAPRLEFSRMVFTSPSDFAPCRLNLLFPARFGGIWSGRIKQIVKESLYLTDGQMDQRMNGKLILIG
jgi:hypothetical protein